MNRFFYILYHPNSGKLLINKIVSDNFGSSLLLSLISYVPQDPQIFDGTIYSHISYGLSNTSIEKVKNAAILSGAYEFIKNLPDKFNTLIRQMLRYLASADKSERSMIRSSRSRQPVTSPSAFTVGL